MRGGPAFDDFDIDGRNAYGTHYSHYYNESDDYSSAYAPQASPAPAPVPTRDEEIEAIMSTELFQAALTKCLAYKDAVIRDLQQELINTWSNQ